ncbi:MAG: hypothetical protein DSZ03_07450, partial [Sulfurimonas sp.]
MKRIVLSTLLLMTTLVHAERATTLFPIMTDADYCPAPAVALLGGYGEMEKAYDGDYMYGLEFSLACPALQLEHYDIRQQISLVHQSKHGLRMTSLEFNPHILFDLDENMQLGVGPGFGVIFTDADATDIIGGINIGASVNYDIDAVYFVGAEARYQWTTDADLGNGVEHSLDNYRTL